MKSRVLTYTGVGDDTSNRLCSVLCEASFLWVSGNSAGIISVLDLRTGNVITSWVAHAGPILQVHRYIPSQIHGVLTGDNLRFAWRTDF
jgi:hypothetical protein